MKKIFLLVLMAAVGFFAVSAYATTNSSETPLYCSNEAPSEIIVVAAGPQCTPWVTDCRQGYRWRCEPCGSEWCWIFKGTKC